MRINTIRNLTSFYNKEVTILDDCGNQIATGVFKLSKATLKFVVKLRDHIQWQLNPATVDGAYSTDDENIIVLNFNVWNWK
jgi:transposase